MDPWMIYGANGYTGRLISEQAARLNLRPVLAGRNRSVESLAAGLGLDSRLFPLDDEAAMAAGLAGMKLVLHCAGPFSATAAPMMAACLQAGAHYLDITGEIEVFECAFALDAQAKAKGVVLCPGAGFDVVPTDCLALALREALPDATHLALGFDTSSALSAGTSKTMVEGLKHGGMIRRDGALTKVPFAWRERRIDFGAGAKNAVTVPWGDVSTAFRSTGIGNVECYFALPPAAARGMRWMRPLRPLLGLAAVQSFLKRRIERNVRGPDATSRDKTETLVWGEAMNAKGEKKGGAGKDAERLFADNRQRAGTDPAIVGTAVWKGRLPHSVAPRRKAIARIASRRRQCGDRPGIARIPTQSWWGLRRPA